MQLQQTQNKDEYKEALTLLVDYYLNGYDLEWELLYRDTGYRRISLPTYPFNKDKYWVPSRQKPQQTHPVNQSEADSEEMSDETFIELLEKFQAGEVNESEIKKAIETI